MHYESRFAFRRWHAVPIMLVVTLGTLTISSTARTDYGINPQQDLIRVENRINQLEQRLYSIEASLRNLEQQARLSAVNSRTVNQEDWAFLRSEIQALQNRLIQHECALAKLDERTLTPASRIRRRSASGTNICRENFDEPLRLPDR